MSEVWFYHLQGRGLRDVLPSLLVKSAARGWNAVVQARSAERLAVLDDMLWTFSDESFLAHGTDADGDSAMQPVFLTTDEGNPNGASVRLFVEGADPGPALAAQPYERGIVIFDGDDATALEGARAQWKSLKAEGHAVSYWQEGPQGWEKKA